MALFLFGAALALSGLLCLIAQPIWRGRLSAVRRASKAAEPTLEPREPGAGFRLKENWFGLVLLALGGMLLLLGA